MPVHNRVERGHPTYMYMYRYSSQYPARAQRAPATPAVALPQRRRRDERSANRSPHRYNSSPMSALVPQCAKRVVGVAATELSINGEAAHRAASVPYEALEAAAHLAQRAGEH